ncbi:MAG: enoyl-CoA hydratase/isomerase family protein [Dehalococcoidia bacterium]|nr:enoyl-CoA hydratase/isomerase family protein [Dehalococcoidia bacterium]
MYQAIAVEANDRIARITLAREERRNAISPAMMNELLEAFRKYNDDSSVVVLVLTGAGEKVFCSGADIAESIAAGASFIERYEEQRKFAELFKTIKALKKPLIGRINGHAMGGGLGLAAACDIVVASDDCKFGTPEVNVGLFPYVIMATLLRVATSPKRLLEMMLAGERIDAAEAQRLGIVNHVVPRPELDARVDSIAKNLASKSPATLRMGRRAFYTMRDMEYEKALEYLTSALAINTMAEDVTEGIASFMEKRDPLWKGK